MHKTTVYIPDELKAALNRAAAATRRSEADLIREGIRLVTQESHAPVPTLPLVRSGQPDLAEHVGHALVGFGER